MKGLIHKIKNLTTNGREKIRYKSIIPLPRRRKRNKNNNYYIKKEKESYKG